MSKKRKYFANKKERKKGAPNLSSGVGLILVTCQSGKEKYCRQHLMPIFDDEIDKMIKDNDIIKCEVSVNNKNNGNKMNTIVGDKRSMDNELDEPPKKRIKLDINNNDNNNNEQKNGNENVAINKNENNETKKDNDDDLEEDIDIASAVKKELNTEYKYISWMNGDFGNVLIYIKRNDIDPGTLLNRVFKNTYPKYPNLSPHVLRLYPVFTCYRDQKNLMNLAQKIINMHFKNNNDINMDKTFGIFFKKKVTGIKMDRKELIDNIAKMFPIKKVDLSEPDYALILKPFGFKWCGINIIPDKLYPKFHNYCKAKFPI